MLSSNWSAKLEYLYYDLGSVTCATGGLASDIGAVLNPATSTGVAAVAASSQVRFKDSIVRDGVNHHFGSPAVSARPSCEAGVSGAPHSPFKCDPNRENRPTSSNWPMPRRAGVVHVCIQMEINCLVDVSDLKVAMTWGLNRHEKDYSCDSSRCAWQIG